MGKIDLNEKHWFQYNDDDFYNIFKNYEENEFLIKKNNKQNGSIAKYGVVLYQIH